MAGNRPRAYQDLLLSRGEQGIRPGVLRMLFRGGPARQVATDDTRMGRSESVRPATTRMLFRGGPARAVATQDLRVGHDGESSIMPGEMEMLSAGGDVGEDAGLSDELIMAAEDVGDAFKAYSNSWGDRPDENDSRVERESKEASKRVKAEILAQALKTFFLLCDED